jgi:hypothetical protein
MVLLNSWGIVLHALFLIQRPPQLLLVLKCALHPLHPISIPCFLQIKLHLLLLKLYYHRLIQFDLVLPLSLLNLSRFIPMSFWEKALRVLLTMRENLAR